MPNENRYFIAVIPPEDISAEITAIKHEIARVYNAEKALKVMPHITLKAPFIICNDQTDTLIHWFKTIRTTAIPFDVSLDGFDVFDNPKNPVLFIKPDPSDTLHNLQKEILQAFKDMFPDIPVHFHEDNFHPHITLAYRDLTYPDFLKAKEVFKTRNYKNNFLVKSFSLLKHNGAYWEVIYSNNFKAQ